MSDGTLSERIVSVYDPHVIAQSSRTIISQKESLDRLRSSKKRSNATKSRLLLKLKVMKNNLEILQKAAYPNGLEPFNKYPKSLKEVLVEAEFLNSRLRNRLIMKKMEMKHLEKMKKSEELSRRKERKKKRRKKY